jgi:hypothetical protein
MLGGCSFRKGLSALKNNTSMTLKPLVLSVIWGLSTFGILGGLTAPARADSPITSTPFSEAYQDSVDQRLFKQPLRVFAKEPIILNPWKFINHLFHTKVKKISE